MPRDDPTRRSAAATTAQLRLHRAPRVARRQRVLPVAVRRGGDPDARRRRRVGDDHARRRARATASSCMREIALPALARPALLGVHLLPRLQGQQRRVQADGPRPVRRADLRATSILRAADRPQATTASFRLDMEYFNYCQGLTMTNDAVRRALRRPAAQARVAARRSARWTWRASIQASPRRSCSRMAGTSQRETGMKNLCLAGGVALNCVANGRLLREGPFDDIWIQPAAGDAGGALGAALFVWHQLLRQAARRRRRRRACSGSLPRARSYGDDEIDARSSTAQGARYQRARRRGRAARARRRAAGRRARSSAGSRGAWSSARARSAPAASSATRASPKMQATMNLKIKFRESFRPFAPACCASTSRECFELRPAESPYMLLVAAGARGAARSR